MEYLGRCHVFPHDDPTQLQAYLNQIRNDPRAQLVNKLVEGIPLNETT